MYHCSVLYFWHCVCQQGVQDTVFVMEPQKTCIQLYDNVGELNVGDLIAAFVLLNMSLCV